MSGFDKKLPRINTLWVDGALSYVEQVCLTSAIEQGHRVTLYTYHGVDRVPAYVEIRDAREVLPESRMIKQVRRNSWAHGADIFRYELMKSQRGIWVDADVYFVKPLYFSPDQKLVFGKQDDYTINNAVFYTAPEHSLTQMLCSYFSKEYPIPYWLPWRKRQYHRMRRILGRRPVRLENQKWGIAGPHAVTHFARQLNVFCEAAPVEVFYPYSHEMAKAAFDPRGDIRKCITDRTITIHLWNEMIKPLKSAPPPPGSFMAEICRAHGVDTAAVAK